MALDASETKIIAHRGFSAAYPENTQLAFLKALEAGADGVECDVRITQDSELILFHDEKTKALCGESGQIERLSWSRLSEFRVLYSEPICRVEEMLESLSPCIINFEIKKTKRYEELIELLYQKMKSYETKFTYMISSLSTDIVRAAYGLKPKVLDVMISPVFSHPKNRGFKKLKSEDWIYSWNVQFTGLRSLVKRRNKGKLSHIKPCWTWTLNTPDEWKLALDSGFDIEAIITDHPDRLKKFLNSLSP